MVNLFINLWFRNVTQNATDVHRCKVNIQLHHGLSCPFLLHITVFSLSNSWNVFIINFFPFSFMDVYGGTLGTLTD